MPVRPVPTMLPIRWSLVAASVLVLVAIVWLRRSEPSFADKLAPFVLDGRLEQRVEARNFAVKVKRIKLAEAYLTEGGEFDSTPRRVASDGIWMSALVEVEPLQEPGYISAWLRTADGREFLAAPHDRPKVKGVNLGEHVRGRHGLRHHAGNPSPRCPCSVCPCKRRGGIRHLHKLKHMDLWPPQA
jgi:hypothetical protein